MKVCYLSQSVTLLEDIYSLIGKSYPEFIKHDHISRKYWNDLFSSFSKYQIIICENKTVIGVGNCIPFYTSSHERLPHEGWDWLLKVGVEQKKSGIIPNSLGALSVSVADEYRKKGVAELILNEMKVLAKNNGLSRLLVPVRPTRKHVYPLMAFKKYVNIKQNNLSIDPWIRLHQKIGGRILNICTHSMRIEGTIQEWESWTGTRFYASGNYHITQGLAPCKIDFHSNRGIYLEPNIWVEHKI